jgi:hypothetical protein
VTAIVKHDPVGIGGECQQVGSVKHGR